tara:strand:+ start:178 stop:435 length:258 start_codon:yes stop_codon:yes gene_type:complete
MNSPATATPATQANPVTIDNDSVVKKTIKNKITELTKLKEKNPEDTFVNKLENLMKNEIIKGKLEVLNELIDTPNSTGGKKKKKK